MNAVETISRVEPAHAGRPSVAEKAAVKIRAHHRERLAVVYVRQSSQHQVLANRESTARQYAFADRAVALGWPRDRVLIV